MLRIFVQFFNVQLISSSDIWRNDSVLQRVLLDFYRVFNAAILRLMRGMQLEFTSGSIRADKITDRFLASENQDPAAIANALIDRHSPTDCLQK